MRKSFLVLMAGALFCGFVFDDKEDLGKATKKTTKLESYAFKLTIEIEGAPMPIDGMEFEGEYQKGVGTHLSGSVMDRDIELYKNKNGKKTATKNEDDEWELAGGGRGPMGRMGDMIKAPHEELKKFEKNFKEVKKAEETEKVNGSDCTVYSGELTEDGIKDMLPGGVGRMLEMAEVSGTAKIWVNEDGFIVKYTTTIDLAIDFQGMELEISFGRTTELSKLNDTKLELPDEVKELFKEAKDTPSEDKDRKDDDYR